MEDKKEDNMSKKEKEYYFFFGHKPKGKKLKNRAAYRQARKRAIVKRKQMTKDLYDGHFFKCDGMGAKQSPYCSCPLCKAGRTTMSNQKKMIHMMQDMDEYMQMECELMTEDNEDNNNVSFDSGKVYQQMKQMKASTRHRLTCNNIDGRLFRRDYENLKHDTKVVDFHGLDSEDGLLQKGA